MKHCIVMLDEAAYFFFYFRHQCREKWKIKKYLFALKITVFIFFLDDQYESRENRLFNLQLFHYICQFKQLIFAQPCDQYRRFIWGLFCDFWWCPDCLPELCFSHFLVGLFFCSAFESFEISSNEKENATIVVSIVFSKSLF